jgi:hypothetical protein
MSSSDLPSGRYFRWDLHCDPIPGLPEEIRSTHEWEYVINCKFVKSGYGLLSQAIFEALTSTAVSLYGPSCTTQNTMIRSVHQISEGASASTPVPRSTLGQPTQSCASGYGQRRCQTQRNWNRWVGPGCGPHRRVSPPGSDRSSRSLTIEPQTSLRDFLSSTRYSSLPYGIHTFCS